MDATLNADGTTYFASNYNVANTIPCNDGTGDNSCCNYPGIPTGVLTPTDFGAGTIATAYSGLSLELSFAGTGYTHALVGGFKVTSNGGTNFATWYPDYIGGYYNLPTWDSLVGGNHNITQETNYSNGSVTYPGIPAGFDNTDASLVGGNPAMNTLAHTPLEIQYTLSFTATIDNPSKSDFISYSIPSTVTLTGGCKLGDSQLYSNANSSLDMQIPGSCILTPISGCTLVGGYNYNPDATVNDGSCCYYAGCTDSTATNYDATACYDDGSCIATVYGCTDSTALNYYAGANTDDGTCCSVSGCTDPCATNYNALACIDDASCILPGCQNSIAAGGVFATGDTTVAGAVVTSIIFKFTEVCFADFYKIRVSGVSINGGSGTHMINASITQSDLTPDSAGGNFSTYTQALVVSSGVSYSTGDEVEFQIKTVCDATNSAWSSSIGVTL